MKPKDTQIIKAKATEITPIQDEATALISQAINKGVDVDTMERLLAMRRELKAEKAKEAYDQAMANFQKAMPTIQKKTQGYNYKYADLTTIVEQVKDILSLNGFSYTFDTEEEQNRVVISCKVKHTAGHMEVSKAFITKESTTKMNASQQSGAAMTYGKRYAFVNAFGILTGDEDTDAATPKTVTTQKPSTTQPSKPQEPLGITQEQKTQVILLLNKKGKTMDGLSNAIKVGFNKVLLKDLTASDANRLINKLSSLPDKEEEVKDDESEQIADDVAEGLK